MQLNFFKNILYKLHSVVQLANSSSLLSVYIYIYKYMIKVCIKRRAQHSKRRDRQNRELK